MKTLFDKYLGGLNNNGSRTISWFIQLQVAIYSLQPRLLVFNSEFFTAFQCLFPVPTTDNKQIWVIFLVVDQECHVILSRS